MSGVSGMFCVGYALVSNVTDNVCEKLPLSEQRDSCVLFRTYRNFATLNSDASYSCFGTLRLDPLSFDPADSGEDKWLDAGFAGGLPLADLSSSETAYSCALSSDMFRALASHLGPVRSELTYGMISRAVPVVRLGDVYGVEIRGAPDGVARGSSNGLMAPGSVSFSVQSAENANMTYMLGATSTGAVLSPFSTGRWSGATTFRSEIVSGGAGSVCARKLSGVPVANVWRRPSAAVSSDVVPEDVWFDVTVCGHTRCYVEDMVRPCGSCGADTERSACSLWSDAECGPRDTRALAYPGKSGSGDSSAGEAEHVAGIVVIVLVLVVMLALGVSVARDKRLNGAAVRRSPNKPAEKEESQALLTYHF
jgi:hypothetical protein